MYVRLHRRVQRYGWNLASVGYESLWRAHLADAQYALLELASLAVGDRVLDVACGTGLVAFEAATAVGPSGDVLGVDLSDRMVDAAGRRARDRRLPNCRFSPMDAEALTLPDASFDVALCALGLMYMPDPVQALREMFRMLRPGGRVSLAVWSGSRTLSPARALTPNLRASDTGASQRRLPLVTPKKLATRPLSAAPSHSHGHASMMRSAIGSVPAT